MSRLRRWLDLLVGAAGAAAFTLGGLALVPVAAGRTELALPTIAATAVGMLAAWILHDLLRQHFDDLALLRISVQLLVRGEVPPERLQRRAGVADEVGVIAGSIAALAGARAAERSRPDQRLASVIAALADAVIVVTNSGQISLINATGKSLLGYGRAAVGTSIYGTLDRESVAAAMSTARDAGPHPVKVRLQTVAGEPLLAHVSDFGQGTGAVIVVAAREIETFAEIEHALDLHDVPPPATAPSPETPLIELAAVAVDAETTGLDVALDTLCSIAAVRVHGGHVYRGVTFDQLINPGRSIPARAIAVHGITNAMVAHMPGPGDVLPGLAAFIGDCVVIGHNVGFDLGILRRAAGTAGVPWRDPPWLDVLLLAAALDPDACDLNLESMAARLAIDAAGRHTALGDSLVTAEVYVRLLPILAERGITTFGAARDLMSTATHALRRQKRLGW